MEKILDIITHKMQAAFEAAGYDRSYGRVTVSNRPDLCEYQCNGALAAAKQYHCAPIQIAKAVVAQLNAQDYSLVEAVNPGFINLKLSGHFLMAYLEGMRTAPKFGVGKEAPRRFQTLYAAAEHHVALGGVFLLAQGLQQLVGAPLHHLDPDAGALLELLDNGPPDLLLVGGIDGELVPLRRGAVRLGRAGTAGQQTEKKQ